MINGRNLFFFGVAETSVGGQFFSAVGDHV